MIGSGSRSETLSKKSTLRVCGIKIYVIKSLRQKKKSVMVARISRHPVALGVWGKEMPCKQKQD